MSLLFGLYVLHLPPGLKRFVCFLFLYSIDRSPPFFFLSFLPSFFERDIIIKHLSFLHLTSLNNENLLFNLLLDFPRIFKAIKIPSIHSFIHSLLKSYLHRSNLSRESPFPTYLCSSIDRTQYHNTHPTKCHPQPTPTTPSNSPHPPQHPNASS